MNLRIFPWVLLEAKLHWNNAMGPDECYTDNWFESHLRSSALFKQAASIAVSSKQASLVPPRDEQWNGSLTVVTLTYLVACVNNYINCFWSEDRHALQSGTLTKNMQELSELGTYCLSQQSTSWPYVFLAELMFISECISVPLHQPLWWLWLTESGTRCVAFVSYSIVVNFVCPFGQAIVPST